MLESVLASFGKCDEPRGAVPVGLQENCPPAPERRAGEPELQESVKSARTVTIGRQIRLKPNARAEVCSTQGRYRRIRSRRRSSTSASVSAVTAPQADLQFPSGYRAHIFAFDVACYREASLRRLYRHMVGNVLALARERNDDRQAGSSGVKVVVGDNQERSFSGLLLAQDGIETAQPDVAAPRINHVSPPSPG